MLASSAGVARAQLSLSEALRRADHAGYNNRIASATAAADRARAIAPLRGVLPTARIEGGYARTTDPIGVFGTKLRQRSVSPADFDPTRLNHPAAIGNYQGALVVEQPLVNPDAWAGRIAATRAADASAATAAWTRLTTRTDVIRAYYGAALATERVATLESATRAAHAHESQAAAMVRNGLATPSDALLASVRAGEMDAALAGARGDAATARRQLALAMGLSGDSAPTPEPLPSSATVRAVIESVVNRPAPAPLRADVRAAAERLDAARAGVLRSRAAYLPRINSIARYDWNNPARAFAGDRSWTVGIMATWTPFGGPAEFSDLRASAATERAARAGAEAVAAQARLDDERTRTELEVALARLDIAARGATQSAEAHRIVARKYAAGLATVVELLDALAAETQGALALSQARYAAIAAAAARLQATGADPGVLAALDSASPPTTPTPNR